MVKVLKGGVKAGEMVKIKTPNPQVHPKIKTLKMSSHNPVTLSSAAVKVAGQKVSFDANYYREKLHGKEVSISAALDKIQALSKDLTPLSNYCMDISLQISKSLADLDSIDYSVFSGFVKRIERRKIFGTLENDLNALEKQREVIRKNIEIIRLLEQQIQEMEIDYEVIKVLYPIILEKERGNQVCDLVNLDSDNILNVKTYIVDYKLKLESATRENMVAAKAIDKAKVLLKVYMDGGERDASLQSQIASLVKGAIAG